MSGIAQGDLSESYQRWIDGHEYPDLGRALEVIGYEARRGTIREIEDASESQLRAREDFFSMP